MSNKSDVENWNRTSLEGKIEVPEGPFGGVNVVSILEQLIHGWGCYRNGLIWGRVLVIVLVVTEDCGRP